MRANSSTSSSRRHERFLLSLSLLIFTAMTCVKRWSKLQNAYFCDSALPVTKEHLYSLAYFAKKPWTKFRLHNFLRTQWSFLAPVFGKNKFKMDMDSDYILPFTWMNDQSKEGAFSRVFQVKVHESNLSLSLRTVRPDSSATTLCRESFLTWYRQTVGRALLPSRRLRTAQRMMLNYKTSATENGKQRPEHLAISMIFIIRTSSDALRPSQEGKNVISCFSGQTAEAFKNTGKRLLSQNLPRHWRVT